MAIKGNLLARRFTVPAPPNCFWVSDITYLLDAGGLALSRGNPGPLLAPGGRLVDKRRTGAQARARCA
jgi:hypothetical protein